MESNKIFSAVFFVFMVSSCSKPDDPPSETQGYQVEVLEYKTNIPLAGVKVDLFTCILYDGIFGCRSKGIVASKLTDGKGVCSFTSSEYNIANEGITLSKTGYWNSGGGAGKNYLQPEAFITLHLIRQNTYPDTSLISLEIAGELGKISYLSFKAPLDSILTVRAFGNENNNTKWTVFTRTSGCTMFCASDTLAAGNFSRPLAKLETGTFTLRY